MKSQYWEWTLYFTPRSAFFFTLLLARYVITTANSSWSLEFMSCCRKCDSINDVNLVAAILRADPNSETNLLNQLKLMDTDSPESKASLNPTRRAKTQSNEIFRLISQSHRRHWRSIWPHVISREENLFPSPKFVVPPIKFSFKSLIWGRPPWSNFLTWKMKTIKIPKSTTIVSKRKAPFLGLF